MEKKKCCLKCALFWRKHKCEHDEEQKKASGCFWERIKEYAVVFEEIIFKTISVKPHERIYRDILDWWYLVLFVCGYFYQILLLYVFFFFGDVQAEWFKSVPLVEWLGRNWFWMKILMPLLCTTHAVEIYMLVVSLYSILNARIKKIRRGAANGANGGLDGGGNGNGKNGNPSGNGNGYKNGVDFLFKKERGGSRIMSSWIFTLLIMITASVLWGYNIEIEENTPFLTVLGIVGVSLVVYFSIKINAVIDALQKQSIPEKNNPPENKDKKTKI